MVARRKPISARVLLVAAAAAGLHLLLFWLDRAPAPRRLWGDEIMYADLAQRWARGEPATLELLWPPLYPRLLSAAARFGGLATPAGRLDGFSPALIAVQAVQLGLLVVCALALRALALRLTGSRFAAGCAAALLLLDPQIAAFAHYLWPEVPQLALFLAALWLLVARGDRPGALAAAGLLLGLALLLKTLLLPFLPLLAWPLVAEAGWRRGLARAALVLCVAAATVAPTIVANGRQSGAYVIADSSRFNLWVGLNDRSRRNLVGEIVGGEFERWRASAPTYAQREAILDRQIEALVDERGVGPVLREQVGKQYFRLFHRDSFLTDQLPGGAIAAQGYGYAAPSPWATTLLQAWSHAVYALVLVGGPLGLVLLRGREPDRAARAWLASLAAFVAYNLVIFLLLHVKTRYRVAFLPVMDLYAGAALAWAAARGATGAHEAPSRARLVCAATAALLLLFLAFGAGLRS